MCVAFFWRLSGLILANGFQGVQAGLLSPKTLATHNPVHMLVGGCVHCGLLLPQYYRYQSPVAGHEAILQEQDRTLLGVSLLQRQRQSQGYPSTSLEFKSPFPAVHSLR